MSQIKILIADPNEVYLDGIALEFLKREPDRVDLHGITENDYWEEFCGASEEYSLQTGSGTFSSSPRQWTVQTCPCFRRKI